jgi:hypothetical protein
VSVTSCVVRDEFVLRGDEVSETNQCAEVVS